MKKIREIVRLHLGSDASVRQTGYQTEAAASRCRTDYIYDPSGRVLGVENYWDTYNGSGFNVEAVLANDCQYEYTNLNRGLKTSSSFYKNTAEGSSSWTLDHTETYSYDPSLDFLTGANYGDGLPNQTPSWSYDAAQNRTDSVVDNLNRTTSIGGVATTCDIVGNRLTDGSKSYGWDCLNRMTSYNGSANSYMYRADGMRVSKVAGSTTTAYRYDGQMGMEDVDTTGSTVKVTDYGLGARGVDYIAATQSGTTTVGFPIYDTHGNMTACIFRYGTNYYSVNNQRHYDAWGLIRSGATTGDPKGRYCANLGHKQDDESGLTYMRARYYDASSGRFVSQDQSSHGANWFSYCSDQPVSASDRTGQMPSDDIQQFIRLVKELFDDDLISQDYWNDFMNRSTGLRRFLHDQITKQGYSDQEIKDIVESDYISKQTGEVLGDTEDLLSDIAAGEDPSLLLLEEETVVTEVAEGGLGGA